MRDEMIEKYRKWMLGQGFALSTIRHSLTFPEYLESFGLDMMHLTEEEVTDFIIQQREDGVNLGTINGWLKQINRWARFRGLSIHIKSFRSEGLKEVEYLPDEIVEGIFDYTWPRYDLNLRNRAILLTIFGTGMRISELVALNWKDIDNERRLITIRHGKGNKSRKVPVPQKVIDALQEYKVVRTKSDPRAVFTSSQGRLTDVGVRRIFKEVGKAVGYPSLHPHLARHWRAKNLLKQGVTLNTVQKILGHSNIKTTSVYLEASFDEIVMDIDEKDTFFSENKKQRKKRRRNEKTRRFLRHHAVERGLICCETMP